MTSTVFTRLVAIWFLLWNTPLPLSAKSLDFCQRYNAIQYATSWANQIPLDTRNVHSKGTLPIDDVHPDAALFHRTITTAVTTTAVKPGVMLKAWLEYHLRNFDLIIVFIDDPPERPVFETILNELLHNDSRIMLLAGYPDRSDMDELFYEPEGDRSWQTLDGVDHITFVNHEAVPVAHEVHNPFLECTLFKVNGRLEFIAYGNGKSAVRLAPEIQPWGVHAFTGYKGEKIDMRDDQESPVILHYPNVCFESWVQKYISYGKFSNFWFEDPTQALTLTFMLESRDRLQKALKGGNWEEAREFFNSMIPDSEACERMLQAGDMRRYSPLERL